MSEKKKKKFDTRSLIDAAKKPALIIVGMVGGSLAGKAIDKVLKVDETDEGFSAKKLVSPIVQITAGIGGHVFLKDENLKLVATGVGASGIAKTVKVFLKKDILNGFAGLGEAENPVKQLRIEPYNPDLPELEGLDDDPKRLPVHFDPVDGLENYEEVASASYVE